METRKWFLQALGHQGLNNLLAAYDDKGAQAVCTFAYCEGPVQEPIIFEGRVQVGLRPKLGEFQGLLILLPRARLFQPEVLQNLVGGHKASPNDPVYLQVRLGSDIRVHGRDVCRNEYGEEEWSVTPVPCSDEAQEVARITCIAVNRRSLLEEKQKAKQRPVVTCSKCKPHPG